MIEKTIQELSKEYDVDVHKVYKFYQTHLGFLKSLYKTGDNDYLKRRALYTTEHFLKSMDGHGW